MRLIAFAVPLFLLVGCASAPTGQGTRQQASAAIAKATQRTDAALERAETIAASKLPLVERVERPFLGRRSVALADETQLPAVLQRDVSVAMLFDDGSPRTALGDVEIPIHVFAERLTRATGVPTRVRPDVYLPLSQLVAGRAQTQVAAVAAANAGAAGRPGAPSGLATAALDGPRSVTVTLPARLVAPVPTLLDMINARLGISSRYTAEGVLEFYRLSSETFTVAVQPGDVSYNTQLGQNSTGASNFTSTANVSSQMQARAFSAVVEAVRSMLTPGGTLVGTEITRQITVTDTREVLDAVRAHLRTTNRALGSQIVVSIHVLNCTEDRQTAHGVDWLALYTQVMERSGFVINYRGPRAELLDNGGVFSVSTRPGAEQSSQWNGSSAIARALADAGSTCTERRQVLHTTNGRPVAYALTNQFDYVASTTAAVGGVSGVAVGIQTKTQTVGRILSVLPVTLSDSSVSVDLSLNESVLNALRQQSSGTGSTQQTVQLPDISANQSRHTVILGDGETAVIASIAGSLSRDSRRSLGEGISPGFGGGVSGELKTERVLVLLAARVMPPV